MTENNDERPVVGVNVGSVILTDGSEWSSEEITDLRNKYVEQTRDLEYSKERMRRAMNTQRALAVGVRDAFQGLVDEDDLDVDRANEILEGLGLEPLRVEWDWEAEVTLRGTGKAPTDDALHEAIESASFSIEPYAENVEDLEITDHAMTSVSSSRT